MYVFIGYSSLGIHMHGMYAIFSQNKSLWAENRRTLAALTLTQQEVRNTSSSQSHYT